MATWFPTRRLWVTSADGSDAHPVSGAGPGATAPSWTADGAWIRYSTADSIAAVPAAGGQADTLLAGLNAGGGGRRTRRLRQGAVDRPGGVGPLISDRSPSPHPPPSGPEPTGPGTNHRTAVGGPVMRHAVRRQPATVAQVLVAMVVALSAWGFIDSPNLLRGAIGGAPGNPADGGHRSAAAGRPRRRRPRTRPPGGRHGFRRRPPPPADGVAGSRQEGCRAGP